VVLPEPAPRQDPVLCQKDLLCSHLSSTASAHERPIRYVSKSALLLSAVIRRTYWRSFWVVWQFERDPPLALASHPQAISERDNASQREEVGLCRHFSANHGSLSMAGMCHKDRRWP
jgi:hypothetical protein